MKRILTWILCLFLLAQLPTPPAAAQEAAPHQRVQQTLDAILGFHTSQAGASSVQDWIDTSLAQNAGVGAEWYVLGLSQSGSYDFTAYQTALRAYLDSTTVRSATSRQKYALAFLASGTKDPWVDAVMEAAIGQQGVMSWVYGLHLMTNGCESTAFTKDAVLDELLALQLEDGGWTLRGASADVDVTAMALQALAPCVSHEDVATAAERAVALLAQRQLEDGGFMSYGVENPESAAQVMVALSALDIDPLTDERFIRGGATMLDAILRFQLPDGSFSHTLDGAYNANATSQVFYALIAWQRMLAGQSPLYVLDAAAEPQPAVPAQTEWSYKTIAALVIAAIALLACLVLFILGKRHWKNFLAVLLISALALAFIVLTDFQTADTYYTAFVTTEDAIGSVTLTIRCDTVVGQADYIPADGVILPETTFPIAQGDSVYTVLTRAARTHNIPLENSGAPGMAYLSGIAHLYEYAFGDLSGWVYRVDGVSPSVGCEQYALRDGQKIELHYTLELGQDIP